MPAEKLAHEEGVTHRGPSPGVIPQAVDERFFRRRGMVLPVPGFVKDAE